MMTAEQRDAVAARLAELEMANGGRLTPSDVVNDAEDPDSPLHTCFEWDKDKAAYAYRLDQARALITSVRVIVKTESRSIRAVYYVRDPTADQKEQGYVSTETLRTDTEMAREALVSEFSRVGDMLRRARALATVLNAQDDIEDLLQQVVGLRQRFMEAPAQRQ